MSYYRPIIPYKGENGPFNSRYEIQATTNKALKAQDLDGEFNYVIDSLNKLSNQIAGKTLEIIKGSDKAINRDKIIVTNGLPSPTLSWVKVNSQHIEKNAIENHHINDTSVTTNKINNDAVNNDKIENEAITPNKVKIRFESDTAQYEQKKQWSNTIAETNNKVGTIVGRDIEGDISVSGLKFNSSALQSLPTDLSKYLMVAASSIDKEFRPVALGEIIANLIDEITNEKIDIQFLKDHPIGSFSFTKLRDGDVINGKKISWTLVKDGQVLVTGDSDGAKELGENSIRESVAEHALSELEMPSHSHDIKVWDDKTTDRGDPFVVRGNQCARTPVGTAYAATSYKGGGQPHSHKLDLKRIELPLYKRIS